MTLTSTFYMFYLCLFSMSDSKPVEMGLRRCSTVGNVPLSDLDKLSKQRNEDEQAVSSKNTLEVKSKYGIGGSFTNLSETFSRSLGDLLSIRGRNNKFPDAPVTNTTQTPGIQVSDSIEGSRTPVKMDLRKLMGGYLPHSPLATPDSSPMPQRKRAPSPQENREMNTWAPTSL